MGIVEHCHASISVKGDSMNQHAQYSKRINWKWYASVGLSICFFLLHPPLLAQYSLRQSSDPHKMIIKFRQGTQLLKLAREQSGNLSRPQISWDLSSIQSGLGIERLRPLKPDATLDVLPGGVERIFVASLADSVDFSKALEAARKLKEIEYAEPISTASGSDASIEVTHEVQVSEESPRFPNDPEFPRQWALHNTGENPGTSLGRAGADLAMLPAWQITTGSSDVVVAFLSSGIRADAHEFSGRVLRTGYNFVSNNNDVADDNGIGTFVASVAAATGNNSYLMAGVDWKCQILPIKVLGPEYNLASFDRLARGIVYAADNDARVVCIPIYGNPGSGVLDDAITYAASKGAILVASAPYWSSFVYPASFRNVILVGAVDSYGHRYESYRGFVDFVAPGKDIRGVSYRFPDFTWIYGGPYPAPALAVGVISLMLSLDKSLTFKEVYDILKESATDQIGNPSEDKLGWDQYYGWGRINAYRALRLIQERTKAVPEAFGVSQNYPNPFNSSTVIEYQLKYPMHVSITIYNVLGQPVVTLVDEEQRAGYHHARWDAKVPSGVYLYRLQARPPSGGHAGERVIVNKMILAK